MASTSAAAAGVGGGGPVPPTSQPGALAPPRNPSNIHIEEPPKTFEDEHPVPFLPMMARDDFALLSKWAAMRTFWHKSPFYVSDPATRKRDIERYTDLYDRDLASKPEVITRLSEEEKMLIPEELTKGSKPKRLATFVQYADTEAMLSALERAEERTEKRGDVDASAVKPEKKAGEDGSDDEHNEDEDELSDSDDGGDYGVAEGFDDDDEGLEMDDDEDEATM